MKVAVVAILCYHFNSTIDSISHNNAQKCTLTKKIHYYNSRLKSPKGQRNLHNTISFYNSSIKSQSHQQEHWLKKISMFNTIKRKKKQNLRSRCQYFQFTYSIKALFAENLSLFDLVFQFYNSSIKGFAASILQPLKQHFNSTIVH